MSATAVTNSRAPAVQGYRQRARGVPAAASASVAVAPGDGIGPEIMEATLGVLKAAGAKLDVTPIDIGRAVYLQGITSGIAPEAWRVLRERRVLLKGPITTPQGGGYKSLNVTLRKTLGLYANVRPSVSYSPFVEAAHAGTDLVVIRENEEDLYAGIEHRQTHEVYQCLKLITRPGCERIMRYAFEFARANGRRKVSCFTKDNIMKMTDGLFHRVFDEFARRYPEIETEHLILDIGAARLARRPDQFDVVVLPNLYGDVISDVASELTGSVGLGASANVGENVALFEAVHGSAPDIAGRDLANPSGLLLAAIMMLHHIGQSEAAQRVHAAWLATIEDGIHTEDMRNGGTTRRNVGTREFAAEVTRRLGAEPRVLKARSLALPVLPATPRKRSRAAHKEIVGVDVFVDWAGSDAEELAQMLKGVEPNGLALSMITNRGVKIWPNGMPETFCVDHWRCRFMVANGRDATDHGQILGLLGNLAAAGIDFIKTENLCTFDDEPGYSLGQGQ